MKLGIYKHYRGNHYLLMGVCRHSESLEIMVIYRALYDDYGLWVRPKTIFEEMVEDNGEMIPRFTFIQTVDLCPPHLR
jgi:hypothetical protein